MTLLLTCLTHKFAVQASDRQLTFPDGKIAEDVANKATLLCNQATFALTGLGSVSTTEKTHEFLLDALANHGQEDFQLMLNEISRRATEKVGTLRLPGTVRERSISKRTSFVGAGFIGGDHPVEVAEMPPTTDGLFPFFAIVSNAQSGVLEEWRDRADPIFKFSHKYLAPEALFGLHVAGQRISPRQRSRLTRLLVRSIERDHGPVAVARHLTRTVREVSKTNPFVGSNVMNTIVYRERTGDQEIALRGPTWPVNREIVRQADFFQQPIGLDPMWIYCPASYDDQVHYMPNMACGGMEITGGIMSPTEEIEGAIRGISQGAKWKDSAD